MTSVISLLITDTSIWIWLAQLAEKYCTYIAAHPDSAESFVDLHIFCHSILCTFHNSLLVIMPSSLLLLGASLSVGAALPLLGLSLPTLPVLYAAGFQNPSVSLTQGGAGTCVSGTIPVTASAQNVQLNFPMPAVSLLLYLRFQQYNLTHISPESINNY